MANYLTKQEMANMVGSWHPWGYHGHARAKSRIEFSNYYRQLAKPVPPERFNFRQRSDVLRHMFSNHDNKQALLNDPMLFGTGFGKKKIESKNRSKFDPEFISWNEASGRDRYRNTIYQRDYGSSGSLAGDAAPPPRPNVMNSKLLTARQSVENGERSVYKVNYSHGEPNTDHSKQIREETYNRFINKNRAKSCMASHEKITVANCLVWNDGKSNYVRPQTTAVQSQPPADVVQQPSTES